MKTKVVVWRWNNAVISTNKAGKTGATGTTTIDVGSGVRFSSRL
jgi:hypothetical protein